MKRPSSSRKKIRPQTDALPSQKPNSTPDAVAHPWKRKLGRSPRYLEAFRGKRLAGICALLLIVMLGWVGGPAYFTNHFARNAILRLDPSSAEHWLGWSQWLAPNNTETHLMLARLARRRGDLPVMTNHLHVARSIAEGDPRISREFVLADAQQSKLAAIEPMLNRWLLEQDADSAEICDAYVNGLVAASRFEMAERVLDAWQNDFPTDPRPRYRRGRLFQHFDHFADAEAAFRSAIALKPDYYAALYSFCTLGDSILSAN